MKKCISAVVASIVMLSCNVQPNLAYDYRIDSQAFHRAPINMPSDDFWYPPFLIGKWSTKLKFAGATFTDKISVEKLSANDAVLPGFSKYSVFMTPDIGKDIQTEMRYVQLDSHPREDHPQNIKHMVKAFIPEAVVDSAPYAFQKAPDWFHAPANHWHVKYHDKEESGEVDLFTRKRRIVNYSGSVDTVEFIRQTLHRHLADGTTKKEVTEYALNWKLAVPASLKDEYIEIEKLSRTNRVLGSLDVLVYLPSTSDLYNQVPATPAGVYTYDVTMDRIVGDEVMTAEKTPTIAVMQEEMRKAEYPFVFRGQGPVELDTYFGY
jgi:hypothetical protein